MAASGCASHQKGKVVENTLEAMSKDQRRAVFDKTTSALDRQPELVDELYAVAREHPQMMHRFLENASRDLKEPALARETAALLIAHPHPSKK